jgi:hypothetical protein
LKSMLLYPIGTTEAVKYAVSILQKNGVPIIDHPAPEVTHLLLDVPGFTPDGSLRGGGEIRYTLERLPPSITVIGGNLQHPALEEYRKADLLTDEDYLCENAAITAECALRIASPIIKTTFRNTHVLVIGWGRIGKYLAQLLKSLGAEITVAARQEKDRAILRALGYRTLKFGDSSEAYQLIFNTVPFPYPGTVGNDRSFRIELASAPGLTGPNLIPASGLPGRLAPESSGKLIADTLLRMYKEGRL